MTLYLVPIVEGQTEVACVERLLQRIWTELLNAPDRLQVLPASRSKRDAMVNPEHADLGAKVEEAHAKLARRLRHDPSGRGLLLPLLDAEMDCPARLAPTLLEAARKRRSDAPIACVLPKRMLENWIVAGGSGLAGVNGLPDPLPARDQFEERNGAAWLEAQLRSKNKTRKYRKTDDAEAFIRALALQECRDTSPSFDKLCRVLAERLPRSPVQESAAEPSPPSEQAP